MAPRGGVAMRIAVLDDFQQVYETSAGVARLRERAEVVIHTEPARSREELAERLRGVPIIIANRERTAFPAEVFPLLPDLELLCQTGGHAYHVDLPAATAAGVALITVPGGTPET